MVLAVQVVPAVLSAPPTEMAVGLTLGYWLRVTVAVPSLRMVSVFAAPTAPTRLMSPEPELSAMDGAVYYMTERPHISRVSS